MGGHKFDIIAISECALKAQLIGAIYRIRSTKFHYLKANIRLRYTNYSLVSIEKSDIKR